MSDDSSTETTTTSSDKLKVGVGVWLSFCLFVCLWFLSRFISGRRQLRHNLHVIEDGLRRMQDEMEKRQRENSITYGEGFEGLSEMLKKHTEKFEADVQEQAQQEHENPTFQEERQKLIQDGGDEEKQETEAVPDKKND